MNMTASRRIGLAILICYAAGFVGSLFVGPDLSTWYARLIKPALTPPSWVFFPVWIVLYGLMGLAMGLVWTKTALWHPWIGCFLIGLAFSAAWTMFFFGFRTIFIALMDVACLLMIVICLCMGAREIDKRASYLLLTYLACVLFATYLNLGIWYLN